MPERGVRRWVPEGLRRYVPKSEAAPVPDPPNAWDMAALEGADREEVAFLLDELSQIAEVDWAFRNLKKRRDDVFVRLAQLKITIGRMQRHYAIEAKTIISHVGVLGVLRKYGIEPGSQDANRLPPTQPSKEDQPQ